MLACCGLLDSLGLGETRGTGVRCESSPRVTVVVLGRLSTDSDHEPMTNFLAKRRKVCEAETQTCSCRFQGFQGWRQPQHLAHPRAYAPCDRHVPTATRQVGTAGDVGFLFLGHAHKLQLRSNFLTQVAQACVGIPLGRHRPRHPSSTTFREGGLP